MSPQAPQWLCDKFPGDDAEALEVLEANFVVPKGFIIAPKVSGYLPTTRENEAIDYLFYEWDYGYAPTTVAERELGRDALQKETKGADTFEIWCVKCGDFRRQSGSKYCQVCLEGK